MGHEVRAAQRLIRADFGLGPGDILMCFGVFSECSDPVGQGLRAFHKNQSDQVTQGKRTEGSDDSLSFRVDHPAGSAC